MIIPNLLFTSVHKPYKTTTTNITVFDKIYTKLTSGLADSVPNDVQFYSDSVPNRSL